MQQAPGGPEPETGDGLAQMPRRGPAFAVLTVSTILGTLAATSVASLAVLGPLLIAELGLTAA